MSSEPVVRIDQTSDIQGMWVDVADGMLSVISKIPNQQPYVCVYRKAEHQSRHEQFPTALFFDGGKPSLLMLQVNTSKGLKMVSIDKIAKLLESE